LHNSIRAEELVKYNFGFWILNVELRVRHCERSEAISKIKFCIRFVFWCFRNEVLILLYGGVFAVFESLSQRFSEVFKNIRGLGKISESNIEEAVKQVKLALLEADVNYRVVKDFIEQVKTRALGQEVLTSVLPEQQFVKIVDELVALMRNTNSELQESKFPPTIIMLVGLQGTGKTTVAAKIANFLKTKRNKNVLLVACDVYRPAAIKQLDILAQKAACFFYGDEKEKNPVKIAEMALSYAKSNSIDYVVLDTAGRLEVNQELMHEIKELKMSIKPHEVLYVADAMMGQTALDVAHAFHDAVGLTGVYLSKLDGDARGGVALSIKKVLGCPIKFIGVGEKIEDIELFYPERMASRILGMGDIVSFVEKVNLEFDADKAKELEKKMKKKGLDMNDFLEQIRQIRKMGSIKDLIALLPGAGSLKDVSIDEKQFTRVEAMIYSMTKQERLNPEVLNGSRRKRIALGSGSTIQDVNEMLRKFDMMNKMIKSLGSMGKGGPGKFVKQNPFRKFF